jgi:hypothetical protein
MGIEEKKEISIGRLIPKAKFESSGFIPVKVQARIKSSNFYLLIYIPSDDIIKISVFPCSNPSIKKILIRLKEFSPDLVKGISDVLKNFNLGDGTVHTTGLCFQQQDCFYETYLDSSNFKDRQLSLEEIRQEFLKVPRVEDVEIYDITPSE